MSAAFGQTTVPASMNLDLRPVRVERRPIELRPLPDQGQRVLRGDVADDLVPVEVELPLLRLVLRVKMPRLVLLVLDPDDDAEEHRDDGLDRV